MVIASTHSRLVCELLKGKHDLTRSSFLQLAARSSETLVLLPSLSTRIESSNHPLRKHTSSQRVSGNQRLLWLSRSWRVLLILD